ncbi:MAG: T9SS type A sorting domain-containing protein [Calditrichota bacterium]
MKNANYYRLCSSLGLCILFLSSWVTAQPQITSTDLLNMQGKTIVTSNDDRFSFPINLGMPGSNQTWDFSMQGIPSPVITTSEYLEPNGTPFDTAFTDANLAIRFTEMGSPGFEGYAYYNVEASVWTELGTGTILPPPLDSTFARRQEVLASPLPITMNSTWTVVTTDTLGDYPNFATIEKDSCVIIVDGWGTLITEFGTYQCLRFQEQFFNQSQTIVNGIPISFDFENYYIYRWVNGELLEIAYAQSQDGETNPNFTNASGFSVISGVTTGIEDLSREENLAEGFQLEQNYPNPFNPSTTIRFSLQKAETIRLSIFNQLGQKVETLINEQMSAGSYSLTWNAEALPSGVYYYSLHAGDNKQMRKAILLK